MLDEYVDFGSVSKLPIHHPEEGILTGQLFFFGNEALDMLFLGLRGAHSLPSAAGQEDQTVYSRTVVEKLQQTSGIGSGEVIKRVDIGTGR